jgi:hypothetical protein
LHIGHTQGSTIVLLRDLHCGIHSDYPQHAYPISSFTTNDLHLHGDNFCSFFKIGHTQGVPQYYHGIWSSMCVSNFECELQKDLHLKVIAMIHPLDWPYTSYYPNTTAGSTLCPSHSDYPHVLTQSKYEFKRFTLFACLLLKW